MNLEEALKIFGIEEKISLTELKKIFREMIKKDCNNKKLIEAYKFLINVLENFEIEVESLKTEKSEYDRLKRRFSDDWLSGKNF